MDLKYLLLITAVVGAACAGKHDMHSGNSVHGVKLRDSSDQRLLYELVLQLDLDVWQRGMPGQRDALVMVKPANRIQFFEALDDKEILHYVQINDVVKSLEDMDDEISRWRSTRTNRMIFQDYPRYDEVDAYLESIAERFPNLVTLVNAGLSFEGRVIKYLKISTSNFEDPSKPIYFMSAMLHAREWVTTPITLYSIFRLVENLRTEDSDLLSDIDWIILPLANPDGYEFSHNTNRLWRKTRSFYPEVNDTCIGVDGNRNFDVFYNIFGVSQDPCSDIYPGQMAFSEAETRYMRDILLEYVDRMQLFMDIHSFGNYILFGYGDASLTPNAPQLHHVGAAMGAVIDSKKLPKAPYYLVGNSASVLYAASGASDDYGTLVGVPFSYTLEVPGYEYGFAVPPQYMDQINEETWQGIAVTARLSTIYYRSRLEAATSTTTTTTPTTTTPETTTTPTTTTTPETTTTPTTTTTPEPTTTPTPTPTNS